MILATVIIAANGPPVHAGDRHRRPSAAAPTKRLCTAAVRLARRLMAAPELARYYEREEFPGAGVETDDEWPDVARGHCNTCYHPIGTCKMGHDPHAVVNDKLKVHGIDGLRVVDASIMPTLVSGNTNAAAIMIGEKAADMILRAA